MQMPPATVLPLRVGVGAAVAPAAGPSSYLGFRRRRSSSSYSRWGGRLDGRVESRSRRRWWSDELEVDDGDDDAEEEEDGGAFGGGAIVEPWFTKLWNAYGYVLPLTLASMLLATGPQAFLMAMAIPLAQSAISFLLRSTFLRRRRQQQQDDDDEYYDGYYDDDGDSWFSPDQTQAGAETSAAAAADADASWVSPDQAQAGATTAAAAADGDGDAATTKARAATSGGGFGGWDELDGDRRATAKQKKQEPGGAAGLRRRRRAAARSPPGRMQGSSRYREAPLLMRLLVAVFPFLGSWFRML